MMPLSHLPRPAPRTARTAPARAAFTAPQRQVLDHLRAAAMQARTAARTDLFEACALLSIDGEAAKRTFVETLVKCLSDATGTQIKWFAPKVDELSFDEAWVMRCLGCIEGGDASSLAFLLKSRIAAKDQRYIGFLLAHVCDHFTQNQ